MVRPYIINDSFNFMQLIYQLLQKHADNHQPALFYKDQIISYQMLWENCQKFASILINQQLQPNQRVGIYLNKCPQHVEAIFASTLAGGVFVPINPVLKPLQAQYILKHAGAKILITQLSRLTPLSEQLTDCDDLDCILLIDQPQDLTKLSPQIAQKCQFIDKINVEMQPYPSRISLDMAAILYTSGSTGNPKGVVLSHQNLVVGAQSVSHVLKNTATDRILAVLPFSFDYGLSQITTAFQVGASVILMDYLLPRGVIKAIQKYQVTGLAAVPALWQNLATLDWQESKKYLRYITNSGGAFPENTIDQLAQKLPKTDIFLMYGLTEAFRSTILPAEQRHKRPKSMGKPIPSAELMVINKEGQPCKVNEVGELVHRGQLVSMGYWNNIEKTAIHFKPCPNLPAELPLQEIAVWSGDQVYKDDEDYYYFVGREDDLIKTSGYRVSPTEIELIAMQSNMLEQVAVFGVADQKIGQKIILIAILKESAAQKDFELFCRQQLANYMYPAQFIYQETMPINRNGKIDRPKLRQTIKE